MSEVTRQKRITSILTSILETDFDDDLKRALSDSVLSIQSGELAEFIHYTPKDRVLYPPLYSLIADGCIHQNTALFIAYGVSSSDRDRLKNMIYVRLSSLEK